MLSVCIATYNGERFIKDQIDSILNEIGVGDEIVICDDCSTDGTLNFLEAYSDPRIRVYKNSARLGHVRNFERAIYLAKGEYIFLSDQDDVWIPGRVRNMLDCIGSAPGVFLVASNFDLIGSKGEELGEFRALGKVKRFRLAQVLSIFVGRSPYYGCTFLLKRDALRYCLPIPRNIESHDIWIALILSTFGRVFNMGEPTLKHRIHGGNVTTVKRRELLVILKSRFSFAKALVLRIISLRFGI